MTRISRFGMGLMELTATVTPTAFELVSEGEEDTSELQVGNRVLNRRTTFKSFVSKHTHP